MPPLQKDIPRLHEVLAGVGDAQYAALQAELGCAAQHMAWASSFGGFMRESGEFDAFETTMQVG